MKQTIAILIAIMLSSIAVLANPLFNAIGDKTVVEGETLTFTVTNSAPDNGSSVYMLNMTSPVGGVSTLTILGNPATLTRVSDTGADFSWTAPLVSADSKEDITFSVQDDDSEDSIVVAITVQNKAAGPVLGAIGAKQVNEEATLSFSVTCSAPDNGITAFTLENPSIGTISKVSDTEATFSFTAPLVSQDTVFTQTVKASDSDSETSMTFTITVKNLAGGLEVTDIKFGGGSTSRSNPDEDKESYVNAQFTIKNNDVKAARNLNVVWPSASKYNITLVSSTVQGVAITGGYSWQSLGAGDSVTVTLRARVPDDLSSFFKERTNPNSDRAEDIGDLTISALDFASVRKDVLMEAENNLVIDKLYIKVGDSSEKRYDDGDEVEEVLPGSRIAIRLIAENQYSKSDDITIEDVEFNFFVDEGDFDEDEDETIGDIKEDSTKEGSLSFTLDDEMEEDTYTVRITLEGTDENGAVHGEVYEIDFTVEREDEKIEIKLLELDDDEISLCDERSTNLRVTIDNVGNDDTDEAVLVIQNRPLAILSRTMQIDIESLDDYTKSITINIPADAKEGTYQIEAFTYFDQDEYDDESINSYASVPLRIVKCAATVTPPSGSNNQGGDVTPPKTEDNDVEVVIDKETDVPQGGATAVPVKAATESTSGLYMMLLILGYLVVIAIILKLLISLFRK